MHVHSSGGNHVPEALLVRVQQGLRDRFVEVKAAVLCARSYTVQRAILVSAQGNTVRVQGWA